MDDPNITDFSSAGGNNVLNRTFDESFLFDASTFYNWEQDNVPLAKLISRTNLLHQYAGYPGEEYQPTTMTLSSTADEVNGIYDNIDDIIARIPNRLSFPLLIEICDYGDLGQLVINDVTTVGQGKLEIRNQNYAFGASAVTKTVSAIPVSNKTPARLGDQITNPSGTALAFSALVTIHTPNDASSLQGGIKAVSSVRLGESFYNQTAFEQQDPVTKNYFTTIFAQKCPDTNNETDRLYFSKGTNLGTNEVGLNPYIRGIDNTIVSGTTVTRTDFAPRTESGYGENLEIRRLQLDDDNEAGVTYGKNRLSVALYGNYFRGVTVKNCNGDIKFTNICVDGASGTDTEASFLLSHNTKHGFDVNSSDIILQNTAVCRTRNTGYRFRNSEVGVLGNMIAYRVYPKDVNGTRARNVFGVGLQSNNSTIAFAKNPLPVPGVSTEFNRYQVSFSKNDIGVQLHNSQLEGGTVQGGTTIPNAGGGDYKTSILQSFQNYLYGIECVGSEINYLGRLDVFNNREGIKLLNSVLRSPQFTSDDNEGIGINLESSDLIYGYRGDELYGSQAASPGNPYIPNAELGMGGTWLYSKPAYAVSFNGQNLRASKNSSIKPWYSSHTTSGIPDYIGNWGGQSMDYFTGRTNLNGSVSGGFASWHGSEFARYRDLISAGAGSATDVPGVLVDGNSNVELLNFGAAAEENAPGKGRIAYVTNNSTLALRGTHNSNTTLYLDSSGTPGPTYSKSRVWCSSPVCADNNSTIELTGPTKISRFGVGALADNNSVVRFTTPNNGAIPEVVKYGLLDSRNHTQVEIHSSRACFVANKNSGVVLEHLGGFPFGFVSSVSNPSAAVSPSSINLKYSGNYPGATYQTSALWWSSTSGAYMQAYPNGFSDDTSVALATATSGLGKARRQGRLLGSTGSDRMMENISNGGMVGRAVNGSYLDVIGVNFKFDMDHRSVSGVVYNPYNYGRENYGGNGEYDEPGNDNSANGGTSGGYYGGSGGGSYEGDGGMGQGGQFQYNYSSDCSMMPASSFEGGGQFFGSRIHLWNIADTSRIKAQDLLINGNNPLTECMGRNYHGPNGKWGNSVALDNFGSYGAAAGYATYTPNQPNVAATRGYHNWGIFRLMLGHRGDLKTYYGVSSDAYQNSNNAALILSGGLQYTFGNRKEGWALDQINSQGYQAFFGQGNALPGALANGAQGKRYFTQMNRSAQDRWSTSGADYVFGFGMPAGNAGKPSMYNPDLNYYTPANFNPADVSGQGYNPYIIGTSEGLTNITASPSFSIPPLHGDWQGYMRNFLDETASCVFQNAKHLSGRQIGGVSIYRSNTATGGEGRDGTVETVDFNPGVRSLNIFDLDALV